MGCSVDEDAARGLGELNAALDQSLRIQTGRLDEIRLADVACVDLCLRICVGRVVAAHEAEEEQLVRVTLNSGLGALALLERAAQRLVGEHMLAGVERVLDHPAVLGRRGNDNDSLDVCLIDHLLVIGGGVLYLEVVLRPVQLLLLERAGSDQLAARDLEREVLCVYRAQTAQTYNTDFDILHCSFLLFSTGFLSHQEVFSCFLFLQSFYHSSPPFGKQTRVRAKIFRALAELRMVFIGKPPKAFGHAARC